ncbi:MAG TPA: hypothetical protein VFV72_09595 [Candidatus Limnocylindrales bacterium]|nr:hypothetical protein [Candidatus Limnocylindrales bacterium]
MSSATVAARPGFAMPRIPLWFVGLALFVAVAIGAIAGSAMARSAAPAPAAATPIVRHHNIFPAAKAPTMSDYRAVVANLAAAEERHDFAAQYRFRQELDKVLTPAMIGSIYEKHAQLLSALGNAGQDSHGALLAREIRELCGASAVKARLAFCN